MISGSCRHHCVHMETAQRETSTVTARIDPALPGDAHVIAAMVGELLHEIMAAVNDKVFTFDHHEAEARARAWLSDGSYLVLLARDGGACVGFLALYQSYALYTGGVFGTIAGILCPSVASFVWNWDSIDCRIEKSRTGQRMATP